MFVIMRPSKEQDRNFNKVNKPVTPLVLSTPSLFLLGKTENEKKRMKMNIYIHI